MSERIEKKPTIFVDIRSNLPAVGKTKLAALIADALVIPMQCSPKLKVKVVNAEGDFPQRFEGIRGADGAFKTTDDLLVVIVDNNTPLEPGPTPAAHTYDISRTREAHEVQFGDVRTKRFSAFALRLIQNSLEDAGLDDQATNHILDLVKNDPVFAQIAAERD